MDGDSGDKHKKAGLAKMLTSGWRAGGGPTEPIPSSPPPKNLCCIFFFNVAALLMKQPEIPQMTAIATMRAATDIQLAIQHGQCVSRELIDHSIRNPGDLIGGERFIQEDANGKRRDYRPEISKLLLDAYQAAERGIRLDSGKQTALLR